MNHFLTLGDLTPDEFMGLLDLAVKLKTELSRRAQQTPVENKTIGHDHFKSPLAHARVDRHAMIQSAGRRLL